MSACEAGSARDAHTKAPYPVLHSAQRHRIEGRPRTRPSIPSRKKPLSISSFLIPSRLVMSRLSVRLRPCRLTPPPTLSLSPVTFSAPLLAVSTCLLHSSWAFRYRSMAAKTLTSLSLTPNLGIVRAEGRAGVRFVSRKWDTTSSSTVVKQRSVFEA
jgi:hypothetical protein